MIESRTVRQFGWVASSLALSLILAPTVAADDSKAAWAALVKGGHVALIRHGNAPPGHGGDTAHLMAVGRVESSWVLGPSTPARLLELKELVSTWSGPGTLVLVTHALTVRPLIGILPDQAETLVLKPMPGSEPGAHVVGRIAAPQ